MKSSKVSIKEALKAIEFHTTSTDTLTDTQVTSIQNLFAENYHQANQAYLEHSLKALRRISLAFDEGRLVGFSLADSASLSIPRMEEKQLLVLGGIGCIHPDYRRIGLFSHLANLTGGGPEVGLNSVDRVLACARIAHPASFRSLNRLPGVIPKSGQPLSDWHLEVGEVIARLYGVTLKPGSLIVRGNGTPIGYPNISVEASDEEWLPFSDVNRDQGDSLLGIAWAPDAPQGW